MWHTLSAKRIKSTQLGAEIELDIFAVHAQIPPHYMAWCLDDTFSSKFQRQDDTFSVFLSKITESKHVEYYFEGSESVCEMWLVENKGSGGVLYSGKPTPDYWLLLRAADELGGTDEWINGLKTIQSIQMSYISPIEKHAKLTWLRALSHL